MENAAAGNLILNASINLEGRLQGIDSLNAVFGKTIESIQKHIDKKKPEINDLNR